MIGGTALIKSGEFHEFVNQAPNITYKNNEVSMDKPSPYIIGEGKEEKLVIDTSDKMARKSEGEIIDWMKKENYAVVLTRNRLVFKDDKESEVKSIDLSKGNGTELEITREKIEKWAKYGLYIMIPFTAIFMYGFIFLYLIIKALIYAVIGILITKILTIKLDFNAIQRVAACAIVPMIGVNAIFWWMNQELPTIISIIFTICYLSWGLGSSKEIKPQPKQKR